MRRFLRHRSTVVLATLIALFAAVGLGVIGSRPVSGDVVLVSPIPGLGVFMEGDIKKERSGYSLSIPKIGRLLLDNEHVVRIYRTGDPKVTLLRDARTAEREKQVARLWDFTFQAMCRGYVTEAYELADSILAMDPNHYGAKRMREMYQMLQETIPDDPKLEAFLRKQVTQSGMEIIRSQHYILLHDVPKSRGERVPRPQRRLELLEAVYTIFLQFYYCQGVNLYPPKFLLPVVLFDKESDFQSYASSLSEELEMASGFWHMKSNIGYFYNHSTSAQFREMQALIHEIDNDIDALRRRRINISDIKKFREIINASIEISMESSDLQVISHEGAHQMAGSTGLLPRDIRIPVWVHEGLATYFEAASGTSWAGIGAVSDERLEMYRVIEKTPLAPILSDIDFIVGDHVFSMAGTHRMVLNAYSQSWALTHFLYNRHFREFMEFYKSLGELPHDMEIDANVTTTLFNRSFPERQRKQLDRDWRAYVRGLKTELEKAGADLR